jgi:hypothetical protein
MNLELALTYCAFALIFFVLNRRNLRGPTLAYAGGRSALSRSALQWRLPSAKEVNRIPPADYSGRARRPSARLPLSRK